MGRNGEGGKKKKIISMGKGRSLNFQFSTQRGSMTTKENLISHQAKTFTATLDRLVARFGDKLNNFTKIDKLDLLAILAFWQGTDSRNLECDLDLITLGEFLTLRPSFQADTSQDVNQALTILVDCSEGDAMAVITAIVHQLNDYRQS